MNQYKRTVASFVGTCCLVTCKTRMYLQVNAVKAAECNRIETVDEIPSKSAVIYDGMCIMHQLPKYLETFRDLSSFLLKRITSNDSDHVLFIIDQC